MRLFWQYFELIWVQTCIFNTCVIDSPNFVKSWPKNTDHFFTCCCISQTWLIEFLQSFWQYFWLPDFNISWKLLIFSCSGFFCMGHMAWALGGRKRPPVNGEGPLDFWLISYRKGSRVMLWNCGWTRWRSKMYYSEVVAHGLVRVHPYIT